jgi:hypothetical protein
LLLKRLREGGSPFKTSLGKKFMGPHLNQQLNIMVSAYHPKLLERLRPGGLWFQINLSKKGLQDPFSIKKLSALAHTCHPVMREV